MQAGRVRSRPERTLGEGLPHGVSALAEAERIAPGSAVVALADRWRRAGRTERAEEALRGALARQPDHHAARVALARLLWSRGDEGGAREELERVVAQDPNHWSAWIGLARVVHRKGVLEAERAIVRRLMALRPDDPGLLAWYGRLGPPGPLSPSAGRASHPHLAVPIPPPGAPVGPAVAGVATRVLPVVEDVEARDLIGSPGIRGGTQPSARAPVPPRPMSSVPEPTGETELHRGLAEELAARGELPGALRVLEALVARAPGEEVLRRRYVELGGRAEDLSPQPPEAPDAPPVAEALEAALAGMTGWPADDV